MQDTSSSKQLIVEKVRQATNILVTVGADPSVDSLAAALALTIMLNKLEKHGTAVFSGQIPQAMQFLEPSKTFENNVDSLRDFIISIDKEKADRLRYKLEGDVVRIFITPYKTTITEKDLQFSQGDFNVELIIALGVEKREDLDKAIVAHGRILHDATVVTINANNQQSSLGSVDWHDPQASSLCEVLVSLAEAFQKPGLLDAQIATALLTGIVAATDRFSNQHTSPRVMTMAAQLMAAGANQQLVANNLQAAQGGAKPLPEVTKLEKTEGKDGQLSIDHEKHAEEELAAALPTVATPITPTLDELKKAIDEATPKESGPKKREFIGEPSVVPGSRAVGLATDEAEKADDLTESSWRGRKLQPPTLGGSLSATAQEALDDKDRSEEDKRNQQILSHDKAASASAEPPMPAPIEPERPKILTPEPVEPKPEPEPLKPVITQMDMTTPVSTEPVPSMPPLPVVEPPVTGATEPSISEPAPVSESAPIPVTTPIEPEQPASAPITNIDDARQAVDAALAAQPFNPAGNPLQSVASTPMTQLPTAEPTQAAAPTPLSSMAPTDDTLGGLPPIPPMPPLEQHDPTGLPPMPPALPELPAVQPVPPSTFDQPQTPPAAPNDPAQFKIPGQP